MSDPTSTETAAPAAGPAAGASEGATRRLLDPRTLPIYELYRRFRKVLVSAQEVSDSRELARRVLEALLENVPGDALDAVMGGRIYRREGDALVLVEKMGAAGPAPIGYRVPMAYPIVQEAMSKGWSLVQSDDPRIDPEIEGPVGEGPFAIIVMGDHRQTLLSFSLRDAIDPRELAYALATLQSIAETTWRKQELSGFIEQATRIQTSLLPGRPRAPEGYEIACRLKPAEMVGGDLYDVVMLTDEVFAVTIGDAIGHGLPAALQARDVMIGLRMGLEQQLKAVATIVKLGRVLARSGAPGRFISLCYTELDSQGNVIYVNAGHVAPIIVGQRTGRLEELEATGPVLGLGIPLEGSLHRAFQRLEPGDVLVLYTDGITEATHPVGEEFGARRLVEVVQACAGEGLEATADRVFRAVNEFTGGLPQVDDQSLLLLRRS